MVRARGLILVPGLVLSGRVLPGGGFARGTQRMECVSQVAHNNQ